MQSIEGLSLQLLLGYSDEDLDIPYTPSLDNFAHQDGLAPWLTAKGSPSTPQAACPCFYKQM